MEQKRNEPDSEMKRERGKVGGGRVVKREREKERERGRERGRKRGES